MCADRKAHAPQGPCARVPTRRQRLLDVLQQRLDGWSAEELAAVLESERGGVLEDLRHLQRSLKGSGLALHMLPARCEHCGWEQDSEEPRSPGRCPRCKATKLLDARFRVDVR